MQGIKHKVVRIKTSPGLFLKQIFTLHTHNGCGMFVLCILESNKNQLSLLQQFVRWYRLMNLHTKTY